MVETIGASVKSHCNSCLGVKNHTIIHVEVTRWEEILDEEEGISIDGGDQWTLLRCLGCDAVRLRHQSWFSEDSDERGRPNINTEWFPPSIKRQKPPWRREFRILFDTSLQSYNSLSDEIYEALAIGAHRVATMGIRALVERLMIEQVGDQGNFASTIKAFFEAGHVAPNQQAMFRDTLIEAGHAAMHRGFEPSADTVNTLLDIVEGIMNAIYYAPLLADRVNKTIPKRN
ncbi:hypothetical protein BV97_02061 [Novosphingobium resinovorum]|jgi:hypothetical protein|uniref:DUF4145 domain-containing protein n=1 Tax=Novosphingobium resinovorum TaxID=158500 RepID=A0A031JZ32_9SPHN|nr:DUF4145 domain-containing protein [Novosphingobium resinovorum]EZP82038.1 hypothetical protein BV97_02061 [Novosphingobium resinovorum]